MVKLTNNKNIWILVAVLLVGALILGNQLGLFSTSGGCGHTFAPPPVGLVTVLEDGVPIEGASIEFIREDGTPACIQGTGKEPVFTDSNGVVEGVILPDGNEAGWGGGEIEVYLDGEPTGWKFRYTVGLTHFVPLGEGYASMSGKVLDEEGYQIPFLHDVNLYSNFGGGILEYGAWGLQGPFDSVASNSIAVKDHIVPGSYKIEPRVTNDHRYYFDRGIATTKIFSPYENYVYTGEAPFSELGNTESSWVLEDLAILSGKIRYEFKNSGPDKLTLRYKCYSNGVLLHEGFSPKVAGGNEYRIYDSGKKAVRQYCYFTEAGSVKMEVLSFKKGGWVVDKTIISEVDTPSTGCTPGQKFCTGDKFNICVNGQWENRGKVVGQCGIECYSGEEECRVGEHFVCENSEWENKGTVVGECNHLPSEDDECSEEESKCEGEKYYDCYQGDYIILGKVDGECGYEAPEESLFSEDSDLASSLEKEYEILGQSMSLLTILIIVGVVIGGFALLKK